MERGLSFPGGSVVKRQPASAEDVGLIPESGRSPGGGNGNPLQHSCLGHPMDREVWRTTVHGVAKELETTKQLNSNNMKKTYKRSTQSFQILKIIFIKNFVPSRN